MEFVRHLPQPTVASANDFIPDFLRVTQPQLCQCESCQSMQRPVMTAEQCVEVTKLLTDLDSMIAARRVRMLRALDVEDAEAKRAARERARRRGELLGVHA